MENNAKNYHLLGVFRSKYLPDDGEYHGVRIIGWGEQDDQKYWIIANSYGKNWGDNGFIKMPRGENYALIETSIFCVLPREAFENKN